MIMTARLDSVPICQLTSPHPLTLYSLPRSFEQAEDKGEDTSTVYPRDNGNPNPSTDRPVSARAVCLLCLRVECGRGGEG